MNTLKSEFSSWLTDNISEFTNETWLLTKGIQFWEILSSNKEAPMFAKFITPYFGIVASEAIIERCFWYQRRIIGDSRMQMSKDLEKAMLNMMLSKNSHDKKAIKQ